MTKDHIIFALIATLVIVAISSLSGCESATRSIAVETNAVRNNAQETIEAARATQGDLNAALEGGLSDSDATFLGSSSEEAGSGHSDSTRHAEPSRQGDTASTVGGRQRISIDKDASVWGDDRRLDGGDIYTNQVRPSVYRNISTGRQLVLVDGGSPSDIGLEDGEYRRESAGGDIAATGSDSDEAGEPSVQHGLQDREEEAEKETSRGNTMTDLFILTWAVGATIVACLFMIIASLSIGIHIGQSRAWKLLDSEIYTLADKVDGEVG